MGNCTSLVDCAPNDATQPISKSPLPATDALGTTVIVPPATSVTQSVHSQAAAGDADNSTTNAEGTNIAGKNACMKRESVFSVPVFDVMIPAAQKSSNVDDAVCSHENPLDPTRRRSSGKSTASKRTSSSSRRTSNEKRTSMTSEERQLRAAHFCSTVEAPWSSVATSPTHRWSGTLGNLDGLTERSLSNTRTTDRLHTTDSNDDAPTGGGFVEPRQIHRNVRGDSDSECESEASTVMVVHSEENIVFRAITQK